MLISDKQHQANQENAKHSTGPVTPEGKAAVRLNALTYGLRARSLLITGEDPEEYKQLWDDFLAEWQPANRGERIQLERMATSHWLLARVANGERQIYEEDILAERQLGMLNNVGKVRARLERSYDKGMQNLEHLQQRRKAGHMQTQSAPAPATKPSEPKSPPPDHAPDYAPDYANSDGGELRPAFCAPLSPDTR